MPNKFEVDGRRLEAQDGMVWLAEVEVPTSPPERVRVTSNNEPINFGESLAGVPNRYTPFPLKVGVITRTREGDLPQIQVVVGNARWRLAGLMEDHDGLIGQKAVVRLVSLGELDNLSAQLRFDGEVVSSRMNTEVVSFSIGSFNLKKISFPRNRYVSEHCRFVFGSPECGYALNHPLASFTTCPRTIAACTARGDDEEDVMGVERLHPERFGGFRGTPRTT